MGLCKKSLLSDKKLFKSAGGEKKFSPVHFFSSFVFTITQYYHGQKYIFFRTICFRTANIFD